MWSRKQPDSARHPSCTEGSKPMREPEDPLALLFQGHCHLPPSTLGRCHPSGIPLCPPAGRVTAGQRQPTARTLHALSEPRTLHSRSLPAHELQERASPRNAKHSGTTCRQVLASLSTAAGMKLVLGNAAHRHFICSTRGSGQTVIQNKQNQPFCRLREVSPYLPRLLIRATLC